MKTVSLTDFPGADDTARFAAAMRFCRENPFTSLTVPQGTYTISTPLARETRRHVLTGDWGLNPQSVMFRPDFRYSIGLDFSGQRGTQVEATGATLMVDGFMEPVSIRDCEDVSVKGLTIDHVRKPYSRGRVTHVTEENGILTAEIVFDPETPLLPGTGLGLRTIFVRPEDNRRFLSRFDVLKRDGQTVLAQVSSHVTEGMLFYTIHTYHSRPAILIERAKNIRLTDVTIHSQPGMGIVGNRSENIFLRRLKVVPSPGHHWSVNTDATHFTSIKGTLSYDSCIFEGQGDDSANVHGYYQAIVKRESPCIVWIQEKTTDGTHAQTLDYPDPGDAMELTDYRTLALDDVYTVVRSEPDPAAWMCRVELDHDLPADTDGKMLADVTRLPHLEIVGCTASSHFARSILIKTRSALIEGNIFRDVQGPAIVAAAEAHWFEGVCPAHVVIRGNRIENCGWAWGEAAGVVVKADADEPTGHPISDIVLEGNFIDAPGAEHAVYCRNVRGLEIIDNRANVSGQAYVAENCEDGTLGL